MNSNARAGWSGGTASSGTGRRQASRRRLCERAGGGSDLIVGVRGKRGSAGNGALWSTRAVASTRGSVGRRGSVRPEGSRSGQALRDSGTQQQLTSLVLGRRSPRGGASLERTVEVGGGSEAVHKFLFHHQSLRVSAALRSHGSHALCSRFPARVFLHKASRGRTMLLPAHKHRRSSRGGDRPRHRLHRKVRPLATLSILRTFFTFPPAYSPAPLPRLSVHRDNSVRLQLRSAWTRCTPPLSFQNLS